MGSLLRAPRASFETDKVIELLGTASGRSTVHGAFCPEERILPFRSENPALSVPPLLQLSSRTPAVAGVVPERKFPPALLVSPFTISFQDRVRTGITGVARSPSSTQVTSKE